MNTKKRFTALVALMVVASMVLAAAPVAASHNSTEKVQSTAIELDVQKNGDAVLTVHIGYNLTDDRQQKRFTNLKNNESLRNSMLKRFASDLESTNKDIKNATGRDTNVKPKEAKTYKPDENTGIFAISLTWENLAVVEGDTITLRQPFAHDEVSSSNKLIVTAPDGYKIENTTPTAAEITDNKHRAVWKSSGSYDNFEVVFTQTEASQTATGGGTTESGGTTTPGSPGFGFAIALIALVASALLARRRQG